MIKNNENKENILSKESLLKFLDCEIELSRSQMQESGWTKWALFGGLASLIWLLLTQLENGQASINAIFGLLVTNSLIFDVFFIWKNFINEPLNTNNEKGRFFNPQTLSSSIPLVEVSLLRYGSVLYLTYYISRITPGFPIVISFIVNSFSLLFYLLILVISIFGIPLPFMVNRTWWLKKAFYILIIIIIIFTIYKYFINFANIFPFITNFKIASIISGVYLLFYLLIGLDIESPLFNSLIILRRDLYLSKININEAIEQIDILIAGLKISNLLQEYVESFLEYVHLFSISNKTIQETLAKTNELLDNFDDNKDENKIEKHIEEFENASNIISQQFTICKEIVNVKIVSTINKFAIKIKIINMFSEQKTDEINELFDKIRENLNQISNELNNTFNYAEESKNKIKKFITSH